MFGGSLFFHIASFKGDEKKVELLLKKGANINAFEKVFFLILFIF